MVIPPLFPKTCCKIMIKTEIYNSIYVASKYITIEIDDDI